MRTLAPLLVVAIAAVLQACMPGGGTGACSAAHEYLREHLDSDFEAFAAMDFDTQYEVYICGVQRRHPPRIALAGAFAHEGEPAARFLEGKLRASPNDRTTLDIVRILAVMQRESWYSVRDDRQLRDLMQEKLTSMRTGQTRSQVRDWINEIERAA